MLSQHLITKPVFDALFKGYQFTEHNPVSLTMQKMLDLLETQAFEKETVSLEKFYISVKERASGIDNAAGKQTIIKDLYEKFFKNAFPRVADRLGVVYTPVEVVDFIIKSVEDALRQEFGVGLSDSGVHILDPFTGTGTFMVRLLQSGLIQTEDLLRKYQQELHANEIILLAYYIAAINIEETYHDLAGGEYHPFEGIVLTDTFQMTESKGTQNETIFPENNQRVIRQNQDDIRVIIGNPPYFGGQKSENDSNRSMNYSELDKNISNTYVAHSTATNMNRVYDSYIRAIRWASDRIKDKGIVCYVCNGKFIDGNSMDGLRKCLVDEFSAIYCFNLRGDQRTSGDISKQEGGKIFGSGSRARIAILMVVKNPLKKGACKLYYHDIGDYLTREEKLKIISEFSSIKTIPWRRITPNTNNDWIDQRDPAFDKFIPLGTKEHGIGTKVVFKTYSPGLQSARDAWAYNFSNENVAANMSRTISLYNEQVKEYKNLYKRNKDISIEEFIDNDPKKISWSSSLKNFLERSLSIEYRQDAMVRAMYRPFCKQWLYFDSHLNHRVGQMPKIFPNAVLDNLAIYISGLGGSKESSALVVNCIPDLNMQHSIGQCFPLFFYEKIEEIKGQLPGMETGVGFTKRDTIPDIILSDFRKAYDAKVTKEDIFYYVYGVLHSPEYKRRFESNLKKMLPRIPFAQDFWAFSKAGRELAQWHLNYESIEPYPLQEFSGRLGLNPKEDYRVQKMTFGRRGKEIDKTTIIYNSNVKLSGIPLEAYDYVVNGKPALEWIMERYQLTKDKDSQITNDPNDWSDDPRYILDLVKRIVRVSLETVKIVNVLPALNERK